MRVLSSSTVAVLIVCSCLLTVSSVLHAEDGDTLRKTVGQILQKRDLNCQSRVDKDGFKMPVYKKGHNHKNKTNVT